MLALIVNPSFDTKFIRIVVAAVFVVAVVFVVSVVVIDDDVVVVSAVVVVIADADGEVIVGVVVEAIVFCGMIESLNMLRLMMHFFALSEFFAAWFIED